MARNMYTNTRYIYKSDQIIMTIIRQTAMGQDVDDSSDFFTLTTTNIVNTDSRQTLSADKHC